MIFRTPEAKRDLLRSWNRPDRPFFASGACHILAAAFVEAYPGAGYRPIQIRPDAGHRGGHVIVSNGQTVFDYHGFSDYEIFLAHYFSKVRRFIPGWQGTIVPLMESPSGSIFCQREGCRMPHQFPCDPWPRAFSFLKRFSFPGEVGLPVLQAT
jgi:hypothetical protein